MIVVVWIVVLILVIVIYFRNVYSTLEKYGIKHFKPVPVLGNMLNTLTRKKHTADSMYDNYFAFIDERFSGQYQFLKPSIMIHDLELIKKITLKDFEYFVDRPLVVDDKVEPCFGRNMFSMRGQEWKDMRSTLSPAFTSSKMRNMMTFMIDVNKQMIRMLQNKIQESNGHIDIDCKDLTSRYANDVIATCAYGVKLDSFAEEKNEFYLNGKNIATTGLRTILVLLGYQIVPSLMKKFSLKMFSESSIDFFRSLVMNNMKERELHNIIRPDMIHLLMEAKKGQLKHVEDDKQVADTGFATAEESELGTKTVNREWSDEDILAQAVLFFLAGFETVSTTMCFMMYELARNPDVQRRLADEIKVNDAKNEGKFDYNSIQNLKYLDMVVSESLRMWPPMIVLIRECKKDYNIGKPNEKAPRDYIVRKGEVINVPIFPVHRDPKYYPNPEKFDPERFSDENKGNIKPFSYMPFGVGPRNCIGSRFALCEVKVMIYQMIQQFEISPCEKTAFPPKLDPASINTTLLGGFWLRLKARE